MMNRKSIHLSAQRNSWRFQPFKLLRSLNEGLGPLREASLYHSTAEAQVTQHRHPNELPTTLNMYYFKQLTFKVVSYSAKDKPSGNI